MAETCWRKCYFCYFYSSSDLTAERKNTIYDYEVRHLLNDEKARELFKLYLPDIRKEKTNTNETSSEAELRCKCGTKTQLELYLDLYELCEKFLEAKNIVEATDTEAVEFEEAGMRYSEHRKPTKELKDLIKAKHDKDHSKMKEALEGIQKFCCDGIQTNSEYNKFKKLFSVP